MSELSFERVETPLANSQGITRPSLSYWQDAWHRLKSNPRALASLWLVVVLLAFTGAGPWVWRIDPAAQDRIQPGVAPGADRTAVIVAPYTTWYGPTIPVGPPFRSAADMTAPTERVWVVGDATTQSVRIQWLPVPGASSYRVYRNVFDPPTTGTLGIDIADVPASRVSIEDRMHLEPRGYYYSVVALGPDGMRAPAYRTVATFPARAITLSQATEHGLVDARGVAGLGQTVQLPWHPLGTDQLGRDILARLMHGARVSLFIGIAAAIMHVVLGTLYGAAAGLAGGWLDQLLMRFADFVVALPFLLFMILFRILFGVESGDSGIGPMLVALVLLSWPATARLVRGQILQIREEGYIGASRLLGAKTNYLVLRHMIPNTMGVILVTLTFAVPSAIFTEAFLSFIGMGVAPPTPSWGSMCNEGLKTMLTTPHELIAPAVFISVTVLAFNLLGDGLRDALDARMRARE